MAVEGFFRYLAARPELELSGFGLSLRGWRQLAAQIPESPVGERPTAVISRPAPAAVLLRAWSRSAWPPGRWWTGPAQVVHGTNFVVPPVAAARMVSVWDLTAVHYPELCTPMSRRYPGLVARAVASGAWVHTGARFVADEIVEHFRVPLERVRVVAPPVDIPVRPPAVPRSDGPPYILGLGRTEPRKDFPGLIRAFDVLAGELPDIELHLAGPAGWGEAEVAGAVAAARHAGRIRRLGWVTDRSDLIAGAAVFAYPSLYEGFGLPPLEAMAVGTPVVAARAGAIPEVVGPAADLVAPGDSDELAEALRRVLCDSAHRADLVAAGQRQVTAFAGERTADGLVAAYRDLAGSN